MIPFFLSYGSRLGSAQGQPEIVSERADGDQNNVNDPADAEQAAGEEIQDSSPNFTDIEAVDTKVSKKDGKEQRNASASGRDHIAIATGNGVNIGVGIGVVDDDRGRLLPGIVVLRRRPTVGTNDGLIADFLAAVGTEH